MEVGLRSTGKPVEKLPNPGATAPRFYSTKYSLFYLIDLSFYAGERRHGWQAYTVGRYVSMMKKNADLLVPQN